MNKTLADTWLDAFRKKDLSIRRSAMEQGKEDMLKYCQGILSGDVTIWSDVVDCLAK